MTNMNQQAEPMRAGRREPSEECRNNNNKRNETYHGIRFEASNNLREKTGGKFRRGCSSVRPGTSRGLGHENRSRSGGTSYVHTSLEDAAAQSRIGQKRANMSVGLANVIGSFPSPSSILTHSSSPSSTSCPRAGAKTRRAQLARSDETGAHTPGPKVGAWGNKASTMCAGWWYSCGACSAVFVFPSAAVLPRPPNQFSSLLAKKTKPLLCSCTKVFTIVSNTIFFRTQTRSPYFVERLHYAHSISLAPLLPIR